MEVTNRRLRKTAGHVKPSDQGTPVLKVTRKPVVSCNWGHLAVIRGLSVVTAGGWDATGIQ